MHGRRALPFFVAQCCIEGGKVRASGSGIYLINPRAPPAKCLGTSLHSATPTMSSTVSAGVQGGVCAEEIYHRRQGTSLPWSLQKLKYHAQELQERSPHDLHYTDTYT